MVEVTACHVNMTTKSTEESLQSPSEEIFVFKLFGCTLTCLTHLLKSGLLLNLDFQCFTAFHSYHLCGFQFLIVDNLLSAIVRKVPLKYPVTAGFFFLLI